MVNCLLYVLENDYKEIFTSRPKTLFDIYKNLDHSKLKKLILISNILIEDNSDVIDVKDLIRKYVDEYDKVIIITLNIDLNTGHAFKVIKDENNKLLAEDNSKIFYPIESKLSEYIDNYITILAYTKGMNKP